MLRRTVLLDFELAYYIRVGCQVAYHTRWQIVKAMTIFKASTRSTVSHGGGLSRLELWFGAAHVKLLYGRDFRKQKLGRLIMGDAQSGGDTLGLRELI